MDSFKKLVGLDLFSGIGGITAALQDYVEPAAYCEIERYCQTVILSRMQAGDLPTAPIWDDVRTLPYQELPKIDIIYGGFPCQDISCAGLGAGLAGKRSSLFFEIVRLAQKIQPTFLFLENVPAITGRGGLQVVREIAEMGYDCRWCIISAASVGAMHRRLRWFLLAYANNHGASTRTAGPGTGECIIPINQPICQLQQTPCFGETERTSVISTDVADTAGTGTNGHTSRPTERFPMPGYSSQNFKSRDDWQKTVYEMGQCVDGVSAKLVHNTRALQALGNSVVPQQVQAAFQILFSGKS